MNGNIAIEKLTGHSKNSYYFTDIIGEKYEEVKHSIEVNGIRDPIKVTPAFTVFSGHQRLRIAKELGLTTVPVEISDVDEWEAEYLLIAENVERRGQAESDPIKKGRIASFLKEYWGVKNGGDRKSEGHNVQLKTTSDIAETIGESEKTTQRLLKLNDLIPEIQALVSAGKLGTTAAEQLAHLTTDVQTALYEALGDEIGKRTVAEVKRLRTDSTGKTADEVQKMLDAEKVDRLRLEGENARLRTDLLQAKKPKIIEREVVKEVVPAEMQRKYDEALAESRQMEQSLAQTYARISQLERLEKVVRAQEESPMYDLTRSLQTTNRYFNTFTVRQDFLETAIASADASTTDLLETQLRRAIAKSQQVLSLIDRKNGVVTVTENTNTGVVIYG